MDFSIFPNYILIIVTTIFTCLAANESVYYLKKEVNKESGVHFFNFAFLLVATLILIFLSGFKLKFSLYSILFGLLFGLMTMLFTFFQKKSSTLGPWSYTNVIISLSTVFTAFSGILFFNESITIYKVIGILLMIVCFILANKNEEDDNNKKANIKWFIVAMLAMASMTAIGYIQKVHQSSSYKDELYCFLIVAFLFSSILSLIMYYVEKKKENDNTKIVMNKKTLIFFIISIIISGLGNALENTINLYLSGVMDAAIFFPLINGIPLMVSIIVSLIIFKETLTKKQWIGIAIGIISIILLCI